MKYLSIISLFLLQFALAQSYYPLSIGNQWFYDSSASTTVKVLYDSLFPNGKTYSVLNRQDYANGKYVRVDSQFVYYYVPSKSQEYRIFKINGKVGDTTNFVLPPFMYSRIRSIQTSTVFGEPTKVIKYQLDGLVVSEVILSDKFGLLNVADYGDPPGLLPNIVYNLSGCIINGKKYGYTTAIGSNIIPSYNFTLSQNYPNPFNPTTTIEFSLSNTEFVKLVILDYLGRELTSLVSETLSEGEYHTKWNAGIYASGVYYYRLTVGNITETKKLILLR